MLKRDFRVQGLIGTLIFVAGFAAASWLVAPNSRAADAKDARLKSLLADRLATLRQLATAVRALDQNGLVTPEQLYSANQAAHSAELDLAETDQQRIAIFGKMLAEAKTYESLAHTPAALALDQQAPIRAKVARLDVEIAMERAQAK